MMTDLRLHLTLMRLFHGDVGYTYDTVFLISSYGTPLAQRASFLFVIPQFSFWASGAVDYDDIFTNSINSLLIGSRCIHNDTLTNHC